MLRWLSFSILLLTCQFAVAKIYSLDDTFNPLLEPARQLLVEPGDNLYDIAQRYDTSVGHLKMANPDLPKKLEPWTHLTRPKIMIPVSTMRGIVVDLYHRYLFYYPDNKSEVWVYPIAIGQAGWETPEGKTRIIRKEEDPPWRVPGSIMRKMARKGIYLPSVVPPGPKNPLGTHALRLGLKRGAILIHGTSKPKSIGLDSSHGCIRMYNDHIAELFSQVGKGFPVTVIKKETLVSQYDNADKALLEELGFDMPEENQL